MISATRQRLATQVTLRVGLAALLLALAVFAAFGAPGALPLARTVTAVAALLVVAGLQAATLSAVDRHPWLVDLHFALDVAFISWLLAATGGVSSVFTALYALPVVAAATVQFRRGALQVAALAGVVFAGLALAQYVQAAGAIDARWILADGAPLPSARTAQFTVGINVFAFFAVALLAGQLAEGLRRADVRLVAASEKIADLEAFNRNVIDNLATGLATTDEAGRTLTYNRSAATITGLRDDATGRLAREWLQLPDGFVEAVSAGATEPRARRADYTYTRPDGRTIEVGVTAAPLPLPDGRAGTIFTFQDVTDIKRLERTAQVRERLAAVGEMAAGIAHEIRNPLASMSGSIQLLRQELALTEEQEALMDIVLSESDRLNGTISSFLAYARPQRAELRRVDLRRTVQDAAALLRNSPELTERHALETDTPPDPVWLDADEGQLRQIVWNLATNSLKAMPEGGTLRLSASREAGTVLLRVTDEGIGVPPEEIDAMFHPFRGAFGRGTGLGLAIVHRIVTDYNGKIDVQSRVGAGTTITVRFPAPAGVARAATTG
jgi:two-component system sensor histidine kinase PilS (NtrC family)